MLRISRPIEAVIKLDTSHSKFEISRKIYKANVERATQTSLKTINTLGAHAFYKSKQFLHHKWKPLLFIQKQSGDLKKSHQFYQAYNLVL